jgi:hypothetical protein
VLSCHVLRFPCGIGYDVMCTCTANICARGQVHVLSLQRPKKTRGTWPIADMEPVPSVGKLVHITVTDGYDLVNSFLEIRTVP